MLEASPSLRRVLLADDHGLFRGGLALMLKLLDDKVEVLEANSLERTLECLAEAEDIDLLLLDIMMPGMNSTASIREICSAAPGTPIIVVSVKDDVAAIREALAQGAMGYIPKSSSPNVMLAAIRLVLSGVIYVPPDVLQLGRAEAAEPPEADEPADATLGGLRLTRRLLEVMTLLAEGKSNKAIAGELGLTPGTVKMHTSRLFRLLNVENRTEAVARYLQLKEQERG